MLKRIIVVLAICFTCLFSQAHAAGSSETPDKIVHNFYVWYMKLSMEHRAVDDVGIYKFVDKALVDYVKNTDLEVNYFTQAAFDFPDNIKVVTGKLIRLDKGMFGVPVTFKMDTYNWYVVALVKPHDGSYRIIKVLNIYPYK